MSGGEPYPRTDFPGGVGRSRCRAMGTCWRLSADVRVECGADAACNKKKDEARAQSKLKATSPIVSCSGTGPSGTTPSAPTSSSTTWRRPMPAPRDLTRAISIPRRSPWAARSAWRFSPDGKELAFTSNREADEASTTNADLWTVAVDGSTDELARPRNRTAANKAWDGSPTYSPDGHWLAYRTQRVAGWEADRFRIAVLDRRTGEKAGS